MNDREKKQKELELLQLEEEEALQSQQSPSLQEVMTNPANREMATLSRFAAGSPLYSDASTQNPEETANYAPAVGGALGGVSPIPGGATLGTAIGQGIRAGGFTALNKPLPSVGQHIGEIGLAAASDAMAIPYVKKAIFGRQIGAAEKVAGVPPPQEIKSLPRPVGVQGISNTIDDAIGMINDPNVEKTPVLWKQLKDQVDFFYKRGRDEVLSDGDRSKLAWLSGQVQKGLNTTIPGRAAPAKAMSQAMTIPRKIGEAYGLLPRRARIGLEYFGGPSVLAGVAAEYLRRRMSK
jgi:hypothetical protein